MKSLVPSRSQLTFEARQAVQSWDRSSLGRFASDERILELAESLLRWRYVESQVRQYKETLSGGEMMRDTGARYFAMKDELDSELRMIKQTFKYAEPDSDTRLFAVAEASHFGNGFPTNQYSARIMDIIKHQDYHDYFAVGIWDVDFIKKCMYDGIDAELALALV